MTRTVALDIRAELGECPVWSVEEQALYFVDIKGQALHRFDPTRVRMHDHGHAGGNRLHRPQEGRRLHCRACARACGSSTPKAGVETKLADNPEDQRTSRFNDGRVDPAGRFLAGTIDEPKAARTGASLPLRPARPRRRRERPPDVERHRILAGRAHALSFRYADLHGLALCLRSRHRRATDKTHIHPAWTPPRATAGGPTGRRWMRTGLLLDGPVRGRPHAALFARRTAAGGISDTGPLPYHGGLRRPRPEDTLCHLCPHRPSRRRAGGSILIREAFSRCESMCAGLPEPRFDPTV